jgi:hypothetical protein
MKMKRKTAALLLVGSKSTSKTNQEQSVRETLLPAFFAAHNECEDEDEDVRRSIS